MSYLEEQVAIGRSDWIDVADHRKGIVAREILNFGYRPEEPARSIAWDGLIKFVESDAIKTARSSSAVLMVRPVFA